MPYVINAGETTTIQSSVRNSTNGFIIAIKITILSLKYTGCLKENTADKYGHTKRRYN